MQMTSSTLALCLVLLTQMIAEMLGDALADKRHSVLLHVITVQCHVLGNLGELHSRVTGNR
jgi:hypothetical protein